MRRKLEALKADAAAIQSKAEAEGRILSDDEATAFDAKVTEFKRIEAEIGRRAELEDITAKLAAPAPRVVEPAPVRPSVISGFKATAGNQGFRDLGDFLNAVRNQSYGKADPRLIANAVTTYGGEAVGPDGGFAVPPDFKSTITQAWESDENLAQKFSPISTSANMVTLVADETTPHGTTGIVGSWTDEAGATSPTKPVLRQINIVLRKVQALVHLSDEMLSDVPAISSYVAAKMGAKLTALVSDAVMNGDGNGKPLGYMNSPAKVSVTRDTASNVKAADVTGMVARLRPNAFGKAFWVCHTSVLPQIWTMTLGQQPVYAPNYTVSPFGTLLGRPIFVSEYSQVLGTSGDIQLINPDGYGFAVKSDGISTASTIAFAFDQGLNSYRATMRVGGVPLLSAAIGRKNGSATLSDFVVLT